jgi:hypothetical protein
MTSGSQSTAIRASSSPNRSVETEPGIFPTEYELGRFYVMALCPRYGVLVPVLQQHPEPLDEALGWWRCQVCLDWHLFLVPE